VDAAACRALKLAYELTAAEDAFAGALPVSALGGCIGLRGVWSVSSFSREGYMFLFAVGLYDECGL